MFLVLHTAVTSAPSALAILYGERADASRRTVDEHLLPWLNLPLVAKTLQRGERRHGHGRCLLERHVCRLRHHCSILANTDVLGECATPPAEHLVTRSKLRDVLPDRFPLPR